MADQPRVLSVYEGFFSGGARILHTDAVIGLQELGMDQRAYSINEVMHRESTEQSMYGDRSYMALAAAGIEVATMGRHSEAGGQPQPFSEFEVQQFRHQAADADVILSLKEQPVGLISEAGAEGRPVIACLHRSDPEADPLALGNLVDAVDSGTVTACICCAESTKAAYEAAGIDGSKLEVINNGIDLDRFSPSDEARSRIREEAGIPADVPVVTFAARFDGIKKVPLFIASAAGYLREHEDAHVMMCGAGMSLENGELRGLIEATFDGEDADRIHALGIRGDMEAVYAAADVVALTSRREAYPLSLIE
ncbi:MAG: glycosyltransferase, partial [Candidatus Saccharimonadales bacterium]